MSIFKPTENNVSPDESIVREPIEIKESFPKVVYVSSFPDVLAGEVLKLIYAELAYNTHATIEARLDFGNISKGQSDFLAFLTGTLNWDLLVAYKIAKYIFKTIGPKVTFKDLLIAIINGNLKHPNNQLPFFNFNSIDEINVETGEVTKRIIELEPTEECLVEADKELGIGTSEPTEEENMYGATTLTMAQEFRMNPGRIATEEIGGLSQLLALDELLKNNPDLKGNASFILRPIDHKNPDELSHYEKIGEVLSRDIFQGIYPDYYIEHKDNSGEIEFIPIDEDEISLALDSGNLDPERTHQYQAIRQSIRQIEAYKLSGLGVLKKNTRSLERNMPSFQRTTISTYRYEFEKRRALVRALEEAKQVNNIVLISTFDTRRDAFTKEASDEIHVCDAFEHPEVIFWPLIEQLYKKEIDPTDLTDVEILKIAGISNEVWYEYLIKYMIFRVFFVPMSMNSENGYWTYDELNRNASIIFQKMKEAKLFKNIKDASVKKTFMEAVLQEIGSVGKILKISIPRNEANVYFQGDDTESKAIATLLAWIDSNFEHLAQEGNQALES